MALSDSVTRSVADFDNDLPYSMKPSRQKTKKRGSSTGKVPRILPTTSASRKQTILLSEASAYLAWVLYKRGVAIGSLPCAFTLHDECAAAESHNQSLLKGFGKDTRQVKSKSGFLIQN